ncbi:MAG TPA: DNA-binding response regulator [Bacteroidales bacterium]|jgi:two-component system LytT family response regulator|nr:DNA-binding response regulator [Bacteroidales bacterium]
MKDGLQIKTIIIDDDKHSIEMLKVLIESYSPDIEVVATANNIEEGAAEIMTHNPFLVFLDVEMPGGTGFDLLNMLPHRNFEVIFITAHNRYALQAIKHSALDFLLKPYDAAEFVKTMDRVKENGHNKSVNFDVLLDNLQHTTPKKLVVSSAKGYEYIPIENIVRIESERSYARIFLSNKRVIMVSKCLNEYQNMLDEYTFFRIHNSHLINLNHVVKYFRTDGGYVEMTDGSNIPISRSKKDIFINVMQKFVS